MLTLKNITKRYIIGENAIEALRGVEVDIVLPGRMTGVDLAEELSGRNHPARICLMTSLPAGDALRRRAAAFDLLPKPFDAAGLAAILSNGRAP